MTNDCDEPFLERWLRRKTAARHGAAHATADRERPAEAPAQRVSGAAPPTPLLSLPAIESLQQTSDFSAFMGRDVPNCLRNQALRRLWRLAPALANLDGMNDYDEDFSLNDRAGAVVRTAYDVLSGKVSVQKGQPADASNTEPAQPQDFQKDTS